jgi:hypothetical protein
MTAIPMTGTPRSLYLVWLSDPHNNVQYGTEETYRKSGFVETLVSDENPFLYQEIILSSHYWQARRLSHEPKSFSKWNF